MQVAGQERTYQTYESKEFAARHRCLAHFELNSRQRFEQCLHPEPLHKLNRMMRHPRGLLPSFAGGVASTTCLAGVIIQIFSSKKRWVSVKFRHLFRQSVVKDRTQRRALLLSIR